MPRGPKGEKRPNNSLMATTLSFGTATDSWVGSPRKRSKAASVGGPPLAKAFFAPRRIDPDARSIRLLHQFKAGSVTLRAFMLRWDHRFFHCL
jgi:hypothetical protein